MKTIGERFDEMAEAAGVSKTDKSYYFGRSCCFQITTEQKAIDDAEHTEEMRKLNEEWKENLEIQRKMLIEKACEWLKKNTFLGSHPYELDEFRKAMGE